MQNVMCDKSTVVHERSILNARKVIIKDIPITISAFNSGMLFRPINTFCDFFLILFMPRQAKVPINVETRAATKAIEKVFLIASIIWSFSSMALYHLSENPDQTAIVLALLNENTASVKIGRYRNMTISAR